MNCLHQMTAYRQQTACLKKVLAIPIDKRDEVNYVLPTVQLTHSLLVDDLEKSFEDKIHFILWNACKWSIERAKKSDKNEKISAVNTSSAIHASFSWLLSLLLDLHSHYSLTVLQDAPFPLQMSSLGCPSDEKDDKCPSEETKKGITSYIAVRVGDLYRYMDDLTNATLTYKYSIDVDAENGEGWNQIGVLCIRLSSPLDALYSHYRSLHTTCPSNLATCNILSLLDKHLETDTPIDELSDDEKVIRAVASLHYLKPLPSSLIPLLPPLLDSPRRLIPLVCELSSLDESSLAASSLKSTVMEVMYKGREVLNDRIGQGEEEDSLLSSSSLFSLLLDGVPLPLSSSSSFHLHSFHSHFH